MRDVYLQAIHPRAGGALSIVERVLHVESASIIAGPVCNVLHLLIATDDVYSHFFIVIEIGSDNAVVPVKGGHFAGDRATEFCVHAYIKEVIRLGYFPHADASSSGFEIHKDAGRG